MSNIWRRFLASPVRDWLILFLVVQWAFPLRPSTDPNSRIAMMSAMSEDRSFRIDGYTNLTTDWAKTPSGHYFSSKAPGPSLITFPFFWLFDTIQVWGESRRIDRDLLRALGSFQMHSLLSFVFQAIPFAAIVSLLAEWLIAAGLSLPAVQVFAVAALFGNTASLYMNAFSGHAFTAMLLLAFVLLALKRRVLLASLALGGAVLGDYVSLSVLPLGLGWLMWRERHSALPTVGKVAMGLTPPLVLWFWYHFACFGSPFIVPQHFQAGVVEWLATPSHLLDLLVGPSRGILWTQPWVLAYLFLFSFKQKEVGHRGIIFFATTALLAFLLSNASLKNWEGGSAMGPRYLSPILPVAALALSLFLDKVSVAVRSRVLGTLILSIVFFVLVKSLSQLAPPGQSIWAFYLRGIFLPGSPLLWVKAALLIALFAWPTYRAITPPRSPS